MQKEIHHGNQFGKIAKYGAFTFISSIIMKASKVLLLPVYSRYLSTAEYGLLGGINSIKDFVQIFIGLYVGNSFRRFFFEEKKSAETVTVIFSTIFWFVLIWGTLLVCFLLLLSPWIIQPLLEVPFSPYVPLAIIPILLTQLGITTTFYFRETLNIKLILIPNLVIYFVSIGISLFMLIHWDMKVVAILTGGAVSGILTLAYNLRMAIKLKLLQQVFSVQWIKKILKFSLPLVPSTGSSVIARVTDRLILTYYSGLSQVGLYSISSNIAQLMYMFIDSITQIQGSIGMSALTEDKEAGKKQIAEFISFYIWIAVFFYLGLTLFSKELLYFVTPEEYHSAYVVVGILALNPLMGGLYRPFSSIISLHHQMSIFSYASITSAIFNGVGNFIFIPRFGQLGAAYTTIFSTVIYSTIIITKAQRLDKIIIEKWQILIPVIIGAGIVFCHSWLDSQSLPMLTLFSIKVALIFCFISSLFIFSTLRQTKKILIDLLVLLWMKLKKKGVK